jgi:hypothetical protein
MKIKKIVVAMALVLPAAGAMACASCGCSLNTDIGTQGMGMTEGWTLDVRYDTLNQNKLRYGTKSISQSQAANTPNPKTGQNAEVEGYTQNNYLTASLDYNDGESWGVTGVLPYIMRNHSTFGVYDGGGDLPPAPGEGAYSSKTAGIGDMKIIGRFSGGTWGMVVGHVAPEAYVGGVIALIHEGDSVTIDAHKLLIQLNVSDEEIAKRRSTWVQPKPRYTRGLLAKYARLASTASKGAVTDLNLD